jgi:hypothetical protein
MVLCTTEAHIPCCSVHASFLASQALCLNCCCAVYCTPAPLTAQVGAVQCSCMCCCVSWTVVIRHKAIITSAHMQQKHTMVWLQSCKLVDQNQCVPCTPACLPISTLHNIRTRPKTHCLPSSDQHLHAVNPNVLLPARLLTYRCIPAYPAGDIEAADDAPPALQLSSDQLSHAANPNVIMPACFPAYPSLYPCLSCRKYSSG